MTGHFIDASTFAPLATLGLVGLLGTADDWLNARTGDGIRGRQKILWQTVVALAAAWQIQQTYDITAISVPFIGRGRRSRRGSSSLFAAFAIVATSNGVNITDGLDGLAGGTLIFAFVGYMIIAALNAAADAAQPGHAVRPDHRRAAGLPVVQRPPGADHHGRLGRARARRDAGRHRAHHRPDPAAAADRDHLRGRDRRR